MTKVLGAALVVLSVLLVPTAGAKDYQVNVTRTSSELYKVTGKDIYISTRACFEFVYYDDAVLRMAGKSGAIVFMDAGAKCDVKGVYGSTQLGAGTYAIRVTHEADDWYAVDGTDLVIRTMFCLKYWYSEEVLLRVSSGGTAVIIDKDGDKHLVEGILVQLVL